MSLVRAQSLSKTYRVGDIDVPAGKDLDSAIESASFVGPSAPRAPVPSVAMQRAICSACAT